MYVVKEFPISDEYKKDTGVTAEDVRMFREWLLTQPHLPAEHITDLDLILAYHACERSFSVAKQVLDLNYTLKTHLDVFFKDRCYEKRIEKAMRFALMCGLPTKSRLGYKVAYLRMMDPELSLFQFNDVVRLLFMVLDLYQYEEGTWPGLVVIIDTAQATLGHLGRIDMQGLQHFLYFLQEAALIKLKEVHITNAPAFIDKLLFLIKPFLKKELMEAIRIHQVNSKTLDQYVPMEGLPKEAGGKYKPLVECWDEMVTKIKASTDYFKTESKKRVCESRRPGKPKTVTDFFGSVEGSFKKLDID